MLKILVPALLFSVSVSASDRQPSQALIDTCEAQATLAIQVVQAKNRGATKAQAINAVGDVDPFVIRIIEEGFELPRMSGWEAQKEQEDNYHNTVLMDCLGV